MISLLEPLTSFAVACRQSAYGIPTWYKYLECQVEPGGARRLMTDFSTDATNSLVSIGFAVIEILLLIAGVVAVAFIVVGAYRYVLSQGNPDQTKIAKDAVLNAIIGLIIAILATTLVRYIASELV